MSFSQSQKKTLKIVILGDSGVGKTSLLNRYTSGKFTGQYKATIGADVASKECVLTTTDDFAQAQLQHYVSLQLWDTAGQERFQSLGNTFYRGADAAMLVYDITDPPSLEHLAHWQSEFLNHNTSPHTHSVMNSSSYSLDAVPFPFVVVGNKMDKEAQRRIPPHRALEWCNNQSQNSNHHFSTYSTDPSSLSPTSTASSSSLPHYLCSAKTSPASVDEAFEALARRALQYQDYKQRYLRFSSNHPHSTTIGSSHRNTPVLFVPPPPDQDPNLVYFDDPIVDLRRRQQQQKQQSQQQQCC